MNNKYRNTRFSLVVTAVFVLLLCLPLLQMGLSFYKEPENVEKRKSAEFPKLENSSLDAYGRYARRFEWYYNDHFGFRKVLVRLNSLLHYHVLHTSPKEMVVIGKNGWLYYNNPKDGKNLRDYYGKVNFTTTETERINLRLQRLKSRLDSLHVPVLVVFIPNKHSVYPEYLPSTYSPIRAKITRENQIDSVFRLSGIPYINMQSILLEAKRTYPLPLYYQTDSHWNELGAYIGYRSIMNQLQRKLPVVKSHTLADYDITVQRDSGTGDLANLIFLGGQMTDLQVQLTPKYKECALLKRERSKVDSIVYSNTDTTQLHLLMFHDSFARPLRSLLSESFSRSIYLWRKVNMNLIKKEKPDVLIIEFAERYSDMLLDL